MYSPEVLRQKGEEASADARNALIMSLIGLVCFGFILGILAVKKANSAIETIDIYGVVPEKRSLAVAAKVIGIVDIVVWVLGLIARFTILAGN